MKHFELTPDGNRTRVRVNANTRAGLVVAGVQAVCAAAGAESPADAEEVQQPFSLKAADFAAMYADLLSKAAEQAGQMGELYDDVRFTLITDTKAEGMFVGRSNATFTRAPAGIVRTGLKVERNDAGEWETSFAVEF